MFGLVVAFASLPQLPDDSQPAISQGTIGTRPVMSTRQLVVKVAVGPARMFDALAGQVVRSGWEQAWRNWTLLCLPLRRVIGAVPAMACKDAAEGKRARLS